MKMREFLTRVEATHALGLMDASQPHTSAEAKRRRARVAVRVGATVYEARRGEVLHSQVILRVLRELEIPGAVHEARRRTLLREHVSGWTVDVDAGCNA